GSTVSSQPAASASKAWGVVLGVCCYYALANGSVQTGQIRRLADGLVAAGVAIGLAGLVGTDWSAARIVALPWLDPLYDGLPSVIRGLPGSGLPTANDLFNPREIGGTLALVLPLAAMMLVQAQGVRRLALGLATTVLAAVLLLSQTLSAIGGVAAALWLCAALVDRPRRGRWLVAGLSTVGLS